MNCPACKQPMYYIGFNQYSCQTVACGVETIRVSNALIPKKEEKKKEKDALPKV